MRHIELSDSAARELSDILDDGYYQISPELEELIVTLRGDDQRAAAVDLDDLL